MPELKRQSIRVQERLKKLALNSFQINSALLKHKKGRRSRIGQQDSSKHCIVLRRTNSSSTTTHRLSIFSTCPRIVIIRICRSKSSSAALIQSRSTTAMTISTFQLAKLNEQVVSHLTLESYTQSKVIIKKNDFKVTTNSK